MGERTYTIGEAAKMLGLDGKNSSTVRLWTETFTDWLSPYTRPEKGHLRLYTENDLRSLTLIRDLRRQHVPYEEVRSRLAARSVTSTGEAPAVSPDSLPAVGGSGGLRELLSPVLEVSETLRSFLKDWEYAGGIPLELDRLTASVETLSAKLDRLRYDVELLRAELRAELKASASSRGVGEARTAEDIRPAFQMSHHVRSSPAELSHPPEANGASMVVATIPTFPPPQVTRTVEAKGDAATTNGLLNEYGLRPLPSWLAGRSLGAANLCRRCGSTTKPLGVTPTARAVLSCIECHERSTQPLRQLEREMGIRRGLWARLWHILRHPFGRGRS